MERNNYIPETGCKKERRTKIEHEKKERKDCELVLSLMRTGVERRFFLQGREPTCPVRGLALGQAGKIWKEVAHPDLLNRHRDLAWQVAHGVLPVRAVMHRRGMSRIAVCPRDGCGYEEPVRHLLWDCEAAQALWKEVCPLLQHLYLHPGITLDCQLVLYGTKGKIKANAWTQAWQVVNCTKEALWKARCLLVLEDKLLKKEQMKRVAWAAVKEYMFRDGRRKGQEVARSRTPIMMGQQVRSEGSCLKTRPALHESIVSNFIGIAFKMYVK
ncbi:uncharacterized protein LOC118218663 [Anguilla anguilla]|uniref:uncharacterized protein LOC118218663 n=1 Tax=Anguilla anguilla TaxID=7936 RepID=UPI0015AAAE0F|nr:uncharacterized protein LOC118218663 [Anguilla anguilla]